jgi:hypothetical protein
MGELIKAMEATVRELKEMKKAGVTLSGIHLVGQDCTLLETTDPVVAKRFEFDNCSSREGPKKRK